jgi:hypothetical protein
LKSPCSEAEWSEPTLNPKKLTTRTNSESDYNCSVIRALLDTRRGSEEHNVHLTRLPYTCFIHVVMLIEKVVR